MISWFENDIRLLNLENKMTRLKKEFDKSHKKDSNDYSIKLNRFLSKNLGEEAHNILKEQIFLISKLVSNQI